MKIGILADIHEDVERLDRALTRLAEVEVECLVFLGDLVETGERMHEVGAALARAGVIGVFGNHDLGLCVDPDDETLNRHRGPGLDFLRTLVPRLTIEDCVFSHPLPHHEPIDPEQPWYLEGPPATPEECRRAFAAISRRIHFCGHYHCWKAFREECPMDWDGASPLILDEPHRWLVIVHAIRDGWCAVYDTDAACLTPIRLNSEGLVTTLRRSESENPAIAALPEHGSSAERDSGPASDAELDSQRNEPPSFVGTSEAVTVLANQRSPDAIFDAIRECLPDEHGKRGTLIDELVSRFDPAIIRAGLETRLPEIREEHGSALLRLVEAFADEALLEQLAHLLEEQSSTWPLERIWEALSILQGTSTLEANPQLLDRYDEFADLLVSDDTSITELAELIDSDPDGLWMALDGFHAVEPEIRVEIIESLSMLPITQGIVDFLRILAHCHEPTTSQAAVRALDAMHSEDERANESLRRLALEHRDRGVGNRVRALLQARGRETDCRGTPLAISQPVVRSASMSKIDGRGRGVIVLESSQQDRWSVALFGCDLERGILLVRGSHSDQPIGPKEAADLLLDDPVPLLEVRDPEILVRKILAPLFGLCGPSSSPATAYWIDQTTGLGPIAVELARTLEGETARCPAIPSEDWPARVRAVFNESDAWLEDSELVYEIAEELLIRDGGLDPDPRRDPGAFRYLFENALRDRLDHDRRRLVWMGEYWSASGRRELAETARVLAAELGDAQFIVPGHPFILELALRSLQAAQDHLKREVGREAPKT